MKILRHIFDRIIDGGAILSACMILFGMLSVSAEVFVRYFFGSLVLNWVVDVNGILLLFMTFLGVAWVLRLDEHIRVEIVTDHLNQRSRAILHAITAVISGVAFAFIAWYGAKYTWLFFESGHFQPTDIETPTWIMIIIIPVGCLFAFIQSLRNACAFIRKSKTLERHQLKEHKDDAQIER
jgi:C4-dicarboxylate transporter, DctQ subunit